MFVPLLLVGLPFYFSMGINILGKWCSSNIQTIKTKQAVRNLTLDTNII
jgi:hypothetical protein